MQRTDSFEKTLMLGKTEGRRRRGRQRMKWLDGITDSMDMGLVDSGSWWWTGRPGVLRFMGSQRVGQDWENEQQKHQQISERSIWFWFQEGFWLCCEHSRRIPKLEMNSPRWQGNWEMETCGPRCVQKGLAWYQNSPHGSLCPVFWESTMRTRAHKPWCYHQWCVMDGHGRGSGVNSNNIHDGKWFSAGNLPARDTTPIPRPPCLSAQGVPDKLHQPRLLRAPRLLMEREARGNAWWIHTA